MLLTLPIFIVACDQSLTSENGKRNATLDESPQSTLHISEILSNPEAYLDKAVTTKALMSFRIYSVTIERGGHVMNGLTNPDTAYHYLFLTDTSQHSMELGTENLYEGTADFRSYDPQGKGMGMIKDSTPLICTDITALERNSIYVAKRECPPFGIDAQYSSLSEANSTAPRESGVIGHVYDVKGVVKKFETKHPKLGSYYIDITEIVRSSADSL
ncbi:MAG: hypothetical protein A3I05_03135 [Deltaproteobacteria bacterium RIFCSPLOWO2_02_FULL_44_10]|nr:MAG: hypothetical protein A3I05_03135 [Deltaproteobacteria bacterium RIFCSPLOWO2_02_FULL_44_10]